jgi:hypothetical protein
MCDGEGRDLDMWVVCYEDKLDSIENIGDYLNAFDVITFWTWCGSALYDAERNFDRIRELAPTKRIMAGCYMWNYGESKPLTDDVLTQILKEKGYNIARRTIAKYREQLDIPVARLRKEM